MTTRAAISLLLAAALTACSPRSGYISVDGAMLGTTVHVSARTSLPPGTIYSHLQRIDSAAKASMSVFDPRSLLSRINAGLTDSLDEHIIYNIKLAERISLMSGGRYDITVKPLVEAYGFIGSQGMQSPDTDSILRFVGFSKLHIDGSRLIKDDPRVQIDLNSIAKGYTVDLAARMLDELGIEDYIVEIGGEIRCRGKNSRAGAWTVGIDTPFDGNDLPGRDLYTRVELSDMALATSGNYRRYRIDENGNKVAHTIDPVTGRSSVSRLLSATVAAEECAEADALCTMFMALGADQALEFAGNHPEMAVCFILDNGSGGYETYISEAMKQLMPDTQ